jgi:hypothetical protein
MLARARAKPGLPGRFELLIARASSTPTPFDL